MCFYKPIKIKDILRAIEDQLPKNLRTTEAHFELTGPYKKSVFQTHNKRDQEEMQMKSNHE